MAEPQRYDTFTQMLHWGMALLIVVAWGVALLMDDMPRGPEKAQWIGLHKSIGATVLLLVLVRMLWRRIAQTPAPLPETAAWIRQAATAGHLALYALMLAVPVSGVLMSQAKGHAVSLWGLFSLPTLVLANESLGKAMEELHEVLGNAIFFLAAGHAAVALLHHYVFRDGVLMRMMPGTHLSLSAARSEPRE